MPVTDVIVNIQDPNVVVPVAVPPLAVVMVPLGVVVAVSKNFTVVVVLASVALPAKAPTGIANVWFSRALTVVALTATVVLEAATFGAGGMTGIGSGSDSSSPAQAKIVNIPAITPTIAMRRNTVLKFQFCMLPLLCG
jgi:hypothetical protein